MIARPSLLVLNLLIRAHIRTRLHLTLRALTKLIERSSSFVGFLRLAATCVRAAGDGVADGGGDGLEPTYVNAVWLV